MKLTGKGFLSALSIYFGQEDYDLYIYLFLILLIMAGLGFTYFYYRNKANYNPFDDIPSDEMELLKQISSQKGLSSFDRDFLIMQALNFNVKPSKILLDTGTFDSIEKKIEINVKRSGGLPDHDENFKNMKRLKSRLF